MAALLFGLAVVMMGLFCLAVSSPLAKLMTNWNIFIQQDADILEAYKSMQLRRIRLGAKSFMLLGGVVVVAGLIGWSLEAR